MLTPSLPPLLIRCVAIAAARHVQGVDADFVPLPAWTATSGPTGFPLFRSSAFGRVVALGPAAQYLAIADGTMVYVYSNIDAVGSNWTTVSWALTEQLDVQPLLPSSVVSSSPCGTSRSSFRDGSDPSVTLTWATEYLFVGVPTSGVCCVCVTDVDVPRQRRTRQCAPADTRRCVVTGVRVSHCLLVAAMDRHGRRVRRSYL